MAGYRVHVGNDNDTYLLIDVTDATSPADAMAKVSAYARFRVRKGIDGRCWLLFDAPECGPLQHHDCPEPLYADFDRENDTLLYCDESDTLD